MDFFSQIMSKRPKAAGTVTVVGEEKNGLWELSRPPANVIPSVDIVAVHGLGGDSHRTWTGDNGKLWLRDFLPARLDNSRIFTYGYDAVVAFSKSSAEVDDFARDLLQRVKAARSPAVDHGRPLFFICHSLGGIVVKQALNIAHAHGDTHMASWLKGVVFMGTPHAGSGVAFWASLAGTLLSTASLGTSTNKDLLKLLCKDSTFLDSLSQRFAAENPQLPILSFYELEKFPFLNRRIVEKASARLDLPNETLVPVQADHRAMCRFNDAASQRYRVVEDVIISFIRGAEPLSTLQEPATLAIDVNRRRVLNEWLNPTPTVDTFDRIRSERMESSCRWIYDNTLFQTWLTQPRCRVCHMDGPAGYGKSTVVSKLVEDLRAAHPVAFFFCRIGQESQSWKDIVRTWIWQLLEQWPRPELMSGIFDMCTATLGTTTPVANYFKALVWLVERLDSPFIFLDGMDENPELQKVGVQGLSSHFRDLSKHAKIFTSSRPDPRTKYTLPGETSSFIRIVVNNATNEADISSFLADGLRHLSWDDATTAWVHRKLSDGANGMFLWAKLMLHHIQQQVTLDDLEAAVDELPDGLDTVYARILAKMSALPAPQARSVARVLQWAFSARRPLSLAELEVALAVKPGAGTARLNKRSRAMNIRQLIADFCGPLLEVDPRTSTVRFTHVSALQYLQTLSEQQDESNLPYDPVRFPLMLTKKAPHLAATCLTYLAYSDIDFVTADSSPDVYAARLDQHLHTYKFLRYAALNLWTHFPDGFSFSSGSADPDLTRALDFFFADEKNMVKWLQLYQLLGELATPRSSSSSSRSAFHPQAPRFAGLRQRYAGFRRLGPTASGLFVRWDRWKSEDSFNGNHCSPLTVAAFFDFAAVVRQLLSQMSTKSQGAADAVDNGIVFGYTPFLHAVHGDAADTAALLLAARADPARATTAGYCAARYASRNCIGVLPAILRLDVPWLARQDYEGRTVLHAVCSSPGWDPAVVNSFLGLCSTETARQHLDTQDTLGLTVLHHAANIDVAQSAALMWDRLSHSSDGGSGAERRVVLVSLQEAFTPTTDASIQTWARNWHVFFQGTGEEAPPLDLASLQNLVQRIKVYMLRELVTRRSDVNIADHQGRTTLHICAATHSQQQQHNAGDVTKQLVAKNQCIEALLAGGADPFLRDGVGQLPVDMAIAEGDWPAARLLCGAMQTRLVGAGRPESDCDRTEELQALLLAETTANSDRPRSAPQSPSLSSLSETDWMVVPGSSSSSSSSSFPRTFGDVVKATLILRSCLKLVTGAGDDTSAKLAQRILDAAGYYSVQARAAVDIRSWRPQQDDQDTPRVSLTLALDSRVAVRRIDVFIASERLRPRNYYADSDGRVGSDDGAEKRHEDGGGYYYHYRRTKSNVVLRITSAAWRPSSARSRVGPRRVDSGVSVGDRPETASALSVSSHNTWDTVRGDDSRAASLRSVELDRNTETLLEDIVNGDNDGDESPWYHDSQAFLRVEVASASTPATDKEGKNTPTPPPPPVPRITNLGVLVDRQRNVDIWRHTWPAPRRLPSEENATDTRPRPAHASGLDDGQTREWLASLKHGDTVTLAAAEGFFVQDIARFAKFGLVVYCGLRL